MWRYVARNRYINVPKRFLPFDSIIYKREKKLSNQSTYVSILVFDAEE